MAEMALRGESLTGLMGQIMALLGDRGSMSLVELEGAFQAWGSVVLLAVDRLCEEGQATLKLGTFGYEIMLSGIVPSHSHQGALVPGSAGV